MNQPSEKNHSKLNFQYMRVDQQSETLLGFLLRKFRYHDRDTWLNHIEAGRLQVNHKTGDPNHLLKNGQMVTYYRPDYLEPEVDPFFEVIYEDDFIIAVNKSGDLPTSPSGKYFKNTLVNIIKKSFAWENLYTLHRLDRETSGVILFAKQKEMAKLMSDQFRTHQIKKKYLAILSQHLPYDHIDISMPIGRNPDSIIRIKQGIIPTGKPSQTRFISQEKLGQYDKVEVIPLTGRTHQIRVHCDYLGCPILGDKLYGLPDDAFVQWIEKGNTFLIENNFPTHRQLLHASHISFTHPVTQKYLTIQAPDKLLTQHLQLYHQ